MRQGSACSGRRLNEGYNTARGSKSWRGAADTSSTFSLKWLGIWRMAYLFNQATLANSWTITVRNSHSISSGCTKGTPFSILPKSCLKLIAKDLRSTLSRMGKSCKKWWLASPLHNSTVWRESFCSRKKTISTSSMNTLLISSPILR